MRFTVPTFKDNTIQERLFHDFDDDYLLAAAVGAANDGKGKEELDALLFIVGTERTHAPNRQAIDARHGSALWYGWYGTGTIDGWR